MNRQMLNKRLKPIISQWENTECPSKIDLLLMIALLGITTLCFLYGDVKVTIEHSFNLLDSVFSGRFLDFYQVAIENSTFGHPAVYDFPIYVVFAIWNLPVYILHKITEIDYLNSFLCLLWAKMMMVFFTFLAAKILMKIGESFNLSKERCKWISFFFLTSSAVIIPVFIIVQYDIVAIVFMLLGINAYMKGNTKKFIFWFIFANTMKLFGIFIFIPLILLDEKKIIRIIGKFIAGISGVVVCKLLFGSNAAYVASTKAFSGTMLDRLQATSIKWQYDGYLLPLFVVLMVGVCIFSYAKKTETEQERNYFSIYIPLVVFTGFIGLVPFNPYWMILAAPYMALIIFITPKYIKLNIILETAAAAIMVWLSIMINYPVFGNHIFSSMLLGKISPLNKTTRYTYLNQLFVDLGMDNLINIAAAILVTCIISIIIINYPKKQYLKIGINDEKLERGIIWLRGAVPGIFAALMILCYVLPAYGLIYTSVNGNNINTSQDLLTNDTVVEEKWRFDDDLELKRIEVGFEADTFEWIDSSIINISISNMENGEIIWKESRPVNLFEGDMELFDTDDLLLKSNQDYVLKITAQNGENMEISVRYNNDMSTFETYENGVIQNGNICLNLYGVWKNK